MDASYETYINYGILNIQIKTNEKKFKDIKFTLDDEEIKNENYKKYIYEVNEDNYFLIIKEDNIICKEKLIQLNVKYYITKGPFNYRVNKEPFYSYLENNEFNMDDINELLTREKISYNIDLIKIKRPGEKNFEKMIDNKYKNYKIGKSEIITLEFHLKEKKERINTLNNYNNNLIIKLKNKVQKYLENTEKYDLIYLYSSPLFNEDNDKGLASQTISYREEIKIILNLMKKSKKEFKCLFECASDKVLKDVLAKKKTKILHISSHGILENDLIKKLGQLTEKQLNEQYKFDLILENLGKCCEEQTIKQDTLETYLKSYSSNINKIDLIILTSCFSGGFADLIIKICKPKYIIYVDKYSPINDYVCVNFINYFYLELVNGSSIKEGYDKAINRLLSEKDRLSKFIEDTPENEIKKIKIYDKNQKNPLYLFDAINIGELKINKNIMINFDPKKNISIIGRERKMKEVLEDLKNNNNQFVIIYGDSLDKLDFTYSLCIYLFERKIIDKYKIFDELDNFYNFINYIESEIKKMRQYLNLTYKKILVIKKKDEEGIKTIINTFKKYKEFYFIFLINKENIKEEKNMNCKYINDKLKQHEAEALLDKLCSYYGIKSIKGSFFEVNNLKLYSPKLVNSFAVSKTKGEKTNNNNVLILANYPLYAYLFILSILPSGLPDRFVKIIFNENFNHNLISKNLMNNWNYINTDNIFDNNKSVTEEKFEKYYITYMLKILGLYCKLLYTFIIQKRNEIIYQDEKIHFIFNSYNDVGLWKSNIPKIKDEENINEQDFINDDFNINNHKENIYNLISFLVNKLTYFDDQSIYIEYLSEILLLFPSYFFRKKICKYYIKKCMEFCDKCQEYFRKKLNNTNNHHENKLENLTNIDDNNLDDEELKLKLQIINKQRVELKKKREKFKNNYEKWKTNNSEMKFKILYEKLSLFLYSISSSSEIPNEQNSELKLDLKIIEFLKEKNAEKSKDILNILKNNDKISLSLKAKLFYELGCKYYKIKNKNESKKYLNEALKYTNEDKFLQHRIKVDLCYMFLNEYKDRKEENSDLYDEIKKKISILEKLMENHSNKLYNEEFYLSKKFYELIEPNIIMLNANPLKNDFFNNKIFIFIALFFIIFLFLCFIFVFDNFLNIFLMNILLSLFF